MSKDAAFRFIQDAAGKKEWADGILKRSPDEIPEFAGENGYLFEKEELRQAAVEVLKGTENPSAEPSNKELEEAFSGLNALDLKGGLRRGYRSSYCGGHRRKHYQAHEGEWLGVCWAPSGVSV